MLRKLGDNTYGIGLSKSFGISSTFNIEDLMDYKGPNFNPNSLDNEPSHEPIFEWNLVDNILDDEIITTKDGGTHKYLARWKE